MCVNIWMRHKMSRDISVFARTSEVAAAATAAAVFAIYFWACAKKKKQTTLMKVVVLTCGLLSGIYYDNPRPCPDQ